MKNSLFFILLFSCFSGGSQTDSSNHQYFFEVSVSPNLSYSDITKDRNIDDGHYIFKAPGLGSALSANVGLMFKRSFFTVGFGFSYLTYKKYTEYSFDNNSYFVESQNTLQYHYLFMDLPLRYCMLFGRNKTWFAGVNANLGGLVRFTVDQSEHRVITNNGSPYDVINRGYSSEQLVPQGIVFGGLEFGRRFRFCGKYGLHLSLQLSYSTYISGAGKDRSNYGYGGGSVAVSSLHIGFLWGKGARRHFN